MAEQIPAPTPEPPAPPAPPAPPTPEPPAPEPPAPETDPAPKVGDDQAAVARIQADRDTYKQKVADLEKQLADAKTLEDVEKAKAAAKAEVEAQAAALLLDRTIDVALVQAGCVNTKALKALLDTSKLELEGEKVKGLDTAALAKEYPYLFKTTQTVSTGAPQAGTPGKPATTIAGAVADLYKKGS